MTDFSMSAAIVLIMHCMHTRTWAMTEALHRSLLGNAVQSVLQSMLPGHQLSLL